MSSIFGGSSQPDASQGTSSSSNLAYPGLSTAMMPQVSNGTGASNGLAALLGVGGDPAAQQQAFNTWKASTGYQDGLNQGIQGIVGNNATRGLLDSGATAKGVDTYGQNYANTQYQNYLNPLQSLVSSGNQAGSVIGSTGQVSQSQQTKNSSANSKSGLGQFASDAMMMMFP